MSVLPILTALVGIVGALNLLLIMGVIRRLREHTEMLRSVRSADLSPITVTVPVGDMVATFSAVDVEGGGISSDDLTGSTVVAFLTPQCRPCQEQIPKLAGYLQQHGLDRDQAVVVLVGTAHDTRDLAALIGDCARIVIEPPGGSMAAAFGVDKFPALCVLDADRTVLANGFSFSTLSRSATLSRSGPAW
jgi:hypothetical protein